MKSYNTDQLTSCVLRASLAYFFRFPKICPIPRRWVLLPAAGSSAVRVCCCPFCGEGVRGGGWLRWDRLVLGVRDFLILPISVSSIAFCLVDCLLLLAFDLELFTLCMVRCWLLLLLFPLEPTLDFTLSPPPWCWLLAWRSRWISCLNDASSLSASDSLSFVRFSSWRRAWSALLFIPSTIFKYSWSHSVLAFRTALCM